MKKRIINQAGNWDAWLSDKQRRIRFLAATELEDTPTIHFWSSIKLWNLGINYILEKELILNTLREREYRINFKS